MSFHGSPDEAPARRSARRAIDAWLLIGGLAGEIDRLRWSVDGAPVPSPGIAELLDDADLASQEAQLLFEAELRLGPTEAPEAHWLDSVSPFWSTERGRSILESLGRAPVVAPATSASFRSEAVDFAEANERRARLAAQLCLGVSSHLPASDAVTRSEHAAVGVLERYGLFTLAEDGPHHLSEHWPELEVQLCGILCRLILERPIAARVSSGGACPDFVIGLELDESTRLIAHLEYDQDDRPELVDRLEAIGWSIEAGVVIARFDGDIVVREVSQLILETCRDVFALPFSEEVEIEIDGDFSG